MVEKVRSTRWLQICHCNMEESDDYDRKVEVEPTATFDCWDFTTSITVLKEQYIRLRAGDKGLSLYVIPLLLTGFQSSLDASHQNYQTSKMTSLDDIDDICTLNPYVLTLKCSKRVTRIAERAAASCVQRRSVHQNKTAEQNRTSGDEGGDEHASDTSSNESVEHDENDISELLHANDMVDDEDDENDDPETATANSLFEQGLGDLAEDAEQVGVQAGGWNTRLTNTMQLQAEQDDLDQDLLEITTDGGGSSHQARSSSHIPSRWTEEQSRIDDIELKQVKRAVDSKKVDLTNSNLSDTKSFFFNMAFQQGITTCYHFTLI